VLRAGRRNPDCHAKGGAKSARRGNRKKGLQQPKDQEQIIVGKKKAIGKEDNSGGALNEKARLPIKFKGESDRDATLM